MSEEETKCDFYTQMWNDPEQRNYIIHECKNKDNVGGIIGFDRDDNSELPLLLVHGNKMYSCWYKNNGMTFRCFGDQEKIAKCPLVKKVSD
jgi:hypothetical protein